LVYRKHEKQRTAMLVLMIAAVVNLIVYNLGKAHYQVLAAGNGRQALDLSARQSSGRRSIRSCWISCREVDGLDVCREIRCHLGAHHYIPPVGRSIAQGLESADVASDL
jgi:CheY-like chemotaxis protein